MLNGPRENTDTCTCTYNTCNMYTIHLQVCTHKPGILISMLNTAAKLRYNYIPEGILIQCVCLFQYTKTPTH